MQLHIAQRSDGGGLDVTGMLHHGLVGSPAQVADRIGQFAVAGITRLYLQTPQQFELDHLEYFTQQVAPQLG